MVPQNIEQVVNHLIQVELNSAQLYLAMSNYMARTNLDGMAKWLRLQYEEELGHARKLMDYLNDLGGVAQVRALAEQPVTFGTPLELWQGVLEHEEYVTRNYQQAYEMALQTQDYQAAGLFQTFLAEQVDEVAQATRIVGRLQLAKDNPAALLLLDQEMGQRAG